MSVTIKELSIHCGLSVSTVSKALNDYPDVSEETKQQVRAAADEMGYRSSARQKPEDRAHITLASSIPMIPKAV